MNWVKKLSEMINEAELDEEAVKEFQLQKEEYLENTANDCREVAMREKRVVEAVSVTEKSFRDVHEQSCGEKVRLVVCV